MEGKIFSHGEWSPFASINLSGKLCRSGHQWWGDCLGGSIGGEVGAKGGGV